MAIQGSLGLVPFITSHHQIFTPFDFKKDYKLRFAEHAVLGQKPVHEITGIEATSINFKVLLIHQFSQTMPPEVCLQTLESMMLSDVVEPTGHLLIYNLIPQGKFLITNLSVTDITDNGEYEVMLDLKEVKQMNLIQMGVDLIKGAF